MARASRPVGIPTWDHFRSFLAPLTRARNPSVAIAKLVKVDAAIVVENLLVQQNKTKIDIQRYKGLGEMNAEQLWETTMNAETRTLIQVTVDHIMEEETNVRFRELMGSEVEHRRKFITERAKFATNIDI